MDKLTATTTRTITFTLVDATTRKATPRSFPAGTEVFATARADGTFAVRVAGALYEQWVSAASIAVA